MNTTQSQFPHDGSEGMTESPNTVLVVIDGPGDTTRRPRPPDHPLSPPGRQLASPYPAAESPPPEEGAG